MQKHLQRMLLLIAMLFAVGAANAQTQTLADNYSFVTGVDTARWLALSSPTNLMSGYHDDDASSVVNFGFDFTFCGVSYHQFSVNSNGNFRLGGTATSSSTQSGMFNSSNYTSNLPKIGGVVRDMGTGSGGGVFWEVQGTAPNRVLVCEFRLGYTYGSSYTPDVKWQIQLEETTNKVTIVYGPQPGIMPESWQSGLASTSSDIVLIDPSSHTASYHTGATETTFGSTWHGEGRYYEFAPVTITCPKPTALTYANVGVDAFDVSWTDTSDASSWIVVLTQGSTEVSNDVYYSNTANFTGLAANTVYNVSVAGLCQNGDTSMFRSISVRTACGTQDTLPFFYDFEDAATGSSSNATFIECWNRLNNGTTYFGYPYVSSSTTYNHTPGGSKGLYWYNSNTAGTYGDYQIVVLPPFDTNTIMMNNLQLSFWAKASSDSYQPDFQVGIMTDPTNDSTFQQIAQVEVRGTSWTEYEVNTVGFEGFGNYLAVRALRGSAYWYAYVDDFTVTEAPACPHVENIHVDSMSVDWAQVSWTDHSTASSWVVEYDTVNFVPGAGVAGNIEAVTDSTILITGLDTGRFYYLYVRGDCGSDTSVFRSFTFSTLAGLPASLPYTCNFEGMGSDGWDLINGTQTNAFYVGSATNNGGSKALYISNDGGASCGYNNSSTSYTYAIRTLNIPDSGEFAYSYDWRCQGESHYYDFGRIFLVPATYEWTAGVNPAGSTNAFANWSCPAGWIELTEQFGTPANLAQSSAWRSVTGTFYLSQPGTYNFVIAWANDGSGGSNPGLCIDNVSLIQNTCPSPRNFHVAYAGLDTIIVSWQPGASESSWILSNGIDTLEVYDTTYTFEMLSPSSSYTFSVRGLCDDGDTSLVSLCQGQTLCGIITHDALPYVYGFDDATASGETGRINQCWTLGTNYSYMTYPYPTSDRSASGAYSLYFYGYYSDGTKSWAVLPEFEDDLADLQLKFKIQGAYDYSYYGNSITVGVMTDPNDINTFTEIGTYRATSTTAWDSFTVYLADYTDTGRYITFLARGYNSTAYYGYVYLDDVVVDAAPECGPVTDLHVNATVASALVTWTPSTVGEYAGASVDYREAGDPTASWITLSTPDNYIVINGLNANTAYEVQVTNNCNDGQGAPVAGTFHTTSYGCAEADTSAIVIDTVGNGTATSDYVPAYSFYGNAYCQQIYLASELGGLGRITSMRLNTQAAAQTRTWDIYLAHTSQNSVDSWITPDAMTQVWSGNVNYASAGWVDFNFTTPFDYNGSDNLLVIIDDHTGSYVSGNYAYVHNLPDGRVSRYVYRDGDAYDVINPSANGSGTAIGVRNNMIFVGYGCSVQSSCASPAVRILETNANSATLAWVGGTTETSCDVYYKTIAETNWTLDGTATSTTYTINGLLPGTAYNVKIVTTCDGDEYMAAANCVTECSVIDVLPFTENFNTWGSNTIPNCWNREGSYSNYPYTSSSYHVGTAGSSMYFYLYNNGTNYCKLSLPEIDTNAFRANEVQVVFDGLISYDGYENGVIVGVMVDPNNWSTFTGVDTIMFNTPTGQWATYEVPLANYADTGAYITIAAYTPSGSYTYSYIDNVIVERIPTCLRPDSLMASNATANSVDLGWHDRSGASDWVIEYGPVGFQLGTGTIVAANSNPFTLAGLPSSYDGEYYVRAVCSASDSSEYSRTSCRFSTSQIAASIPYMFDVEDSTEWANWQQNTNNSNVNWFRGTADAYNGTHSFYVSADNGATVSTDMNGVYNVAAWRDIDFGTNDTSFDISFRAKVGGSMTAAYDGLMVFLVDPSVPVVASNANITSPWGNVNDLYRIATARLDTTWHLYRGTFDNISGVHRVAFFWFNQGTGDADFMGTPAAVDDVVIDYATCPRPTDLDVLSIGATSVGLTWNGPASANYRVAYRVAGAPASTNQYVTSTTNSALITGLDTLTSYYFFVRRECSASDNSQYSDGIEVSTSLCDGGSIAYSYDLSATTTTSNYAPMGYSYYNYGYVQTLVDSAALAGLTGEISAMAFNPANGTAGGYFTNMNIFLANVPEHDLSAGFIVPDSTHEFVQVTHNADLSYTDGGWQVFALDTTFVWDGHSSLLVSVKRDHGSYVSGSTFNVHNTSYMGTRYLYQDGSAYDINNPSGGSSGSGNFVGDLQFISCGGAACAAPVITSETHDYGSATIAWSGNGMTYEVAIKANSAADWPVETAVTGNTYTFNGLVPATAYTFRVRQDCSADENGYSAWTYGTFVTDSLPCFAPENLTASNITGDAATFAWTAVGAETNWEIHVWRSGVVDVTVPVNTNPATVTGLTGGLTYNAAVRALCGNDLIAGDWSDTITFATVTCPDVTGLATSNVTFNSVDLRWDANSLAQSYVIEYGFRDFSQGQGTTVTVSTNSYQATGLFDETAYDFYVRAVCGTDWTSDNWVKVSATTASLPDDAYTVTLNVNDPTMGTVTGSGTYAAGTTVTISATANAGYHFVNWSDDNTDATRQIVVNSNITLTANFAADQQGIDEVNGASCTIYPNPATSSTTISVAGVNGMVRIAVVDMNGRVVATDVVECSADCVKTMDVDNLAQGAYFVRITGENVSMVKKLVVR